MVYDFKLPGATIIRFSRTWYKHPSSYTSRALKEARNLMAQRGMPTWRFDELVRRKPKPAPEPAMTQVCTK